MPLPHSFLDNAPTQAPDSNVGIKLSKPGFDANRTAGNNLIFDSSWPSLPIAFETQLSRPYPSTVAHGLNFPPFCMAWAYGPDNSGVGNTAMRFFPSVDKNSVFTSITGLNGPDFTFWANATRVDIKCFMLDLSKDIDYILAPGDTFSMPYDNSYGIKMVKPNKDINSNDLRDFAIHSRAQSPLIQAVKTETTMSPNNATASGGPAIQYTYKGNSPVWVYGYVKSSVGKYRYAPYYGQSYPLTATDGFTSQLPFLSGDVGATLVILRDPMFAPTQTTVQY